MRENSIWNMCVYPLGIYYVVISIAMFLFQQIIPGGNENYMLWQILSTLVTLPVVYYMFYRNDRGLLGKEEKAVKVKPLFLVLALISVLCFSLGLNNLIALTPLMDISKNYQLASENFYAAPAYLTFLGSALLTPLLEELLYRGVIFSRLRKYHGFWLSALVSSFIFAFMHFNLVQFTYAFFFGILLAILTEKGGHFLFAVAGHMLANAFAVIRTETGFLNDSLTGSAGDWMVAVGLCLIAVGLAMIIYGNKKVS